MERAVWICSLAEQIRAPELCQFDSVVRMRPSHEPTIKCTEDRCTEDRCTKDRCTKDRACPWNRPRRRQHESNPRRDLAIGRHPNSRGSHEATSAAHLEWNTEAR